MPDCTPHPSSPVLPLAVRRATVDDRVVLERLWLLFRHDMSRFSGGLPRPDGTFRSEWLDSALASPHWAAFLAHCGDSPVGFAFVRNLDRQLGGRHPGGQQRRGAVLAPGRRPARPRVDRGAPRRTRAPGAAAGLVDQLPLGPPRTGLIRGRLGRCAAGRPSYDGCSTTSPTSSSPAAPSRSSSRAVRSRRASPARRPPAESVREAPRHARLRCFLHRTGSRPQAPG